MDQRFTERSNACLFTPAIWVMAMLFSLAGCSATETGVSQSGKASGVAEGVNPDRAYLSLDQIQPVSTKPTQPENFKPISERAARQIERANQLVADERYTEAAIELERALRYDPNHPDIHRSLAMLHWQAGNLERAKTHVAKALEGNPDDATSHYIQGSQALLMKNRLGAMVSFRTALQCSDISTALEVRTLCHFYLAETLAAEGYLLAALSQYDAFESDLLQDHGPIHLSEWASLTTDGDRRSRKKRAELFEKFGQFTKAADALAPLMKRAGKDVELQLHYATLLLRGKRTGEALVAVQAIPSNDAKVISLLFEIHKKLGHPDQIIQDLQVRLDKNPESYELMASLADVLVRLDRFDEARQQLDSILAANPQAHSVRLKLIDISIERAAWGDAIDAAAAGLTLDPDRGEMYTAKIRPLASNQEAVASLVETEMVSGTHATFYLRGVLALEANMQPQAEAWLQRAHQVDPMFVPGRMALGQTYIRQYRYEEALAVAKRQADDKPDDAQLEHILGVVYERLDRTEQAERHFRAAVQLDRKQSDSHLALAKLFNRHRRRLQAQRQLRVLLDHDPDHDAARELLASTYISERKSDVAVEEFEILRRQTSSPLVQARCDAMLTQMQKPDAPDAHAYRKTLLKAIEKHGGDATTWIAIAESYEQEEDIDAQRQAYEKALTFEPENETAVWGWIDSSKRHLDFEGAAQRLKALLPRRPRRDRWRFALMDLYWTIQDFDSALRIGNEAEQRTDLDSRNRHLYRRAILDTYWQMRRDQDGLDRIKQWVDAEPEETNWTLMLANEYLRQEQPESAITIYEKNHAENPNRNTLKLLVAALEQAKHYQRASQYLLNWINDDPVNDQAIDRLSVSLTLAQRYQEALELIRNRLLHTHARELMQERELIILRQAKRFDEGIELIESLMDEIFPIIQQAQRQGGLGQFQDLTHKDVKRLPDEPFTAENLHRRMGRLRRLLVEVMIQAKDYDAARDHLTTWLEQSRDPRERFSHLRLLAFSYQQQGKDEEAYKIEARALVLQPDNAGLNNDVAYGWINQGVELEKAEERIRFALSRSPRRSAYLDTYGWLMYKKRDFPNALKYLNRSMNTRRLVDPVVADHLGDTYWQVGEKELAVQSWNSAVEAAQKKQQDDLPTSGDERRVRETTPAKIQAAKSGAPPKIAPLGGEGMDQPNADEDVDN